jgi:hypothetical protein
MVERIELEVREATGSIVRFVQGGNKLILIGNGIVKSPGHPAGNQQYSSQVPIINSLIKSSHINVTYKKLDGSTVFMGEYYFTGISKRVSFEGFSYFQFTFIRKNKNKLGNTLKGYSCYYNSMCKNLNNTCECIVYNTPNDNVSIEKGSP